MRRQLHVLFCLLVALSLLATSASLVDALVNNNSLFFATAFHTAAVVPHSNSYSHVNALEVASTLGPATITTINNNTTPAVNALVASAGPDQTVNEGMKNIILDGSKSHYLNGKITSYSWRQDTGPSVNLNSTFTPAVKFNSTCETTNSVLTFRLTVKDNTNATSSSLIHVKVVYGPFSAICKVAVFTSSSLPLTFTTGTTYPFKVNLGTKFNSISKVIAVSKYEPSDPFGNGDKYFINSFGGQNTSTGEPNRKIDILNITDPHKTDQFLGGNFTSNYTSKQGKFTLAGLTFCLEGVPSNITGLSMKSNSSLLANNPNNINDKCNITTSQLQTTIKNTTTSTRALLSANSTITRANSALNNASRYQYGVPQQPPSTFSPQYAYPPYQSSPSQYSSPYGNQYPYPSPQYGNPYPYQNQPPVVNAGPSQVVSLGAFVVLNGAGSYDPSGGFIVSYRWQQIAGAVAVPLAGANTITATFTAPFVTGGTTLTFRLTVTNNLGLSSSSTVNIFITGNNNNQPPVAIATTPSQVVSRGSPVTLDGTGSFSPNGGTIVSYSWVQTAGPSVGVLPNTARPVFIAPQVSATLAFILTVTDSRGAVSSPSSPAFVFVR
ncbi:MAG: hypothetical protein DLM72_05990 [Candidatus Nitrosopolaris wilkensis]|nr:MAG: hypothetical protein DLM72_05990 [Candidatus Nitrosopolaris wilkensis]